MSHGALKLKFHRKPSLDPATTGLSFVSILFALVIGAILVPIQNWARQPAAHSLPADKLMHLAVALAITLASWIGYHTSENRPKFTIRFVNVELVKFLLDILMVVSYFMMAAYAVRNPLSSHAETSLVAAAFFLYLLWDLAGWHQRPNRSNAYSLAWEAALIDPKRTDVTKPWIPVNKWRLLPTLVGFVLTLLICILEWGRGSSHAHSPQFSSSGSIWIDAILILIIVVYRVWKDALPGDRPGPNDSVGSASQTLNELADVATDLSVVSQKVALIVEREIDN